MVNAITNILHPAVNDTLFNILNTDNTSVRKYK